MNKPMGAAVQAPQDTGEQHDQPVISALGIIKAYREGPTELCILDNVDFQIAAGERVAIVGSSGSGKSTLLNILGGLDQPTRGEVSISGQSLTGMNENARARLRNRQLGFVYQFHHLLAEFTSLENVAMPLLLGGAPVADIEPRAVSMLERVGLSHRLNHKPGQLSGGERQRVAIARALVANPQTVLMDEPTGNLDHQTAESVQALMLELNQSLATAFVIVTHDHELARQMDRMLLLQDGHLQPF